MIEITSNPIRPDLLIDVVKGQDYGCIVTYIGLIRNFSQGKPVLCVEYVDEMGNAESELRLIVNDTRRRYPVGAIALSHRVGKIKVGEINLAIAVASSHREDGFRACMYVVDRFKKKLPTQKTETYLHGTP